MVLDWLAKLLNLPAAFWATQQDGSRGAGGGVIQGTASEASLVALLAARAKALGGRPPEDALKLVAYSSDQAHSCLKKACMVSGIQHCRLLPTYSEPVAPFSPGTGKHLHLLSLLQANARQARITQIRCPGIHCSCCMPANVVPFGAWQAQCKCECAESFTKLYQSSIFNSSHLVSFPKLIHLCKSSILDQRKELISLN